MLDSNAPRPRLPTVLTFDDGWYSTYSCLHPVIARHRVPATLYLCTSYFVADLPNLQVTLRYLAWKAGNRQILIQGFDVTLDRSYDLSSTVDKDHLVCTMLHWLQRQGLSREGICLEIERFAFQLGVSGADLHLDSRRFEFVNQAEVLELAANGWSIELHGHLHLYPAGRPDLLSEDIAKCRTEIINAGLPVAQHYCYPSGNYDAEAHRLLKNIGVKSAVTCQPGLIDLAGDQKKYYLSRFLDGEDIHSLEFESEMSGFSDWLRRLPF